MTHDETAELRRKFRDDGAVCIRGALDRDALRLAEDAFNWSLAHPGPGAAQFPGTEAAPGRFYQDLANPGVLDGYRHMLQRTNVGDLVARVWGPSSIWFMYEQVFLKEGGEARRTPWHQDLSYLPVQGEHLVVMWISFDPVAKEDSLEFVRGSHRGILYDGSRFDPNDDTAPLYATGEMPRLPNIEGERAKWDIVSWGVEPGDVLMFHPAMLHGGGATHKQRRRRTLSLRFFGDDAIYVQRPGQRPVTALEDPGDSDDPGKANVFADLARRAKPGDPFRSPLFLKLR
jgi:Phytanoyl-CoA dioxygenase (PhyH)